MNRNILFSLLLAGLILQQWACVAPSDEILSEISIDYTDPLFREIHDYQDRQLKDSLYLFFRHEDPTYRYLAAMAFGSIKDSTANDSLALLLNDPIDEVRAAAAYAIGQAGAVSGETLLLEAFSREDTAGQYWKANRAILEAIGKCGTEENLRALSTISTYQPTDTLLLEGQAWGIYRYALRRIVLPEGTARALALVADQQYPQRVRFIASHYLARAEHIKVDSLAGQSLIQTMDNEQDPRIRMNLAIALGKVKTATARQALLKEFEREPDYRVQANMLRALSNYDYALVQETARQALKSGNIHLAQRAAQYYIENGNSKDATFYWQAAKDTLPWQVQLDMYQAANRYLPAYYVEYRDAINEELRRRFLSANSPYEKAAVLDALAEFGWNYRFIYQEGFKSEVPAIRTATMEALAKVSDMPRFRAFFGAGYRQVRRELQAYFMEAMQSGDPGMIAVAAQALRNESLGYQNYITQTEILDSALARLELPKEIETYNELRHTIAFLKGEPKPPVRKPEYNHPIEWSMLNKLRQDGEKRALIKTQRGNIVIEFMADHAPGTVANFISLMGQGFYANRVFHRVAPNFVIQDGCPRGDGYGSLDYTIRSELPHLHYDQEGYVGMASAGNHTECTQFFITHSPTPHLDGNYTIFARVPEESMDIVHQIQIGDQISDIGWE